MFATYHFFKSPIAAFVFIWGILISSGPALAQTALQPSGSGTEGDPYLINSLENLYWITENPSAWVSGVYYKQTSNIDASSTNGWFSGAGWPGIGNSSTPFKGRYDGQNYVISGLFINGGNTKGLFGKTDGTNYNNRVIITNVVLNSVNISGGNEIGALVGRAEFTELSNCSVSGTVSGNQYTGGVVGYTHYANWFYDSHSSVAVTAQMYSGGFGGYFFGVTAERCYSTGNLTNPGNFVQAYMGGFVGYTTAGSVISSCFSTGNINSNQVTYLGGFVGVTSGSSFSNSYASGNITGRNFIGGFVVINESSPASTFTNCYSSGSITAQFSSIGGFSDGSSNITASNCFWDTESSNVSTSGSGTGKTTAEMKTIGTFSGWNFTTTWQINSHLNGGYPFLIYQNFYNTQISVSNISTSPLIISQSSIAFTTESGTATLNFQEINSTPENLPGGSRTIGKYWNISDVSGGSVKIRLYYSASQKSAFTGTPKIYHYNGSFWEQLPTSSEVSADGKFYVESSNYYNSFSPVTVGDDDSPLPVELISFSASYISGKIHLRWSTLTEVNNYGFELETSQNKLDWKLLDFIPGYGTSNSPKHYTYLDEPGAEKIYYRLKQLDRDGSISYSFVIQLAGNLPTDFSLSQNYPNPFNPSTVISFALPVPSETQLELFDILGTRIAVLLNENLDAGYHSIPVSLSSLASGTYIYRLRAGSFSAVKKMLLIK